MMRSEKRPAYNRAQPPRPIKRRRTRYSYLILTLVVAILLWPVGLFLIWNRRLRCGVGGKLLWSVATLAVFCGLVIALLTVPTTNEDFQRFQDGANDLIATVVADAKVGWETFSERSQDAFVNMRTVGCSAGNFLLNKAADGIEAGVSLGRDARALLEGLFPAAQDESVAPDASVVPDASATPDASVTPRASATPEPAQTADAGMPVSSLDAPELAVSGLALARAGLRESQSTASATTPPPITAQAATDVPEASSAPSEAPASTEVPAATEAVASTEAPISTKAPASTEAASTETPADDASSADSVRETPQPAQAVPTPEPTQAVVAAEAVTEKSVGEFTVYHTQGGSWYHTSADCSGMRGAQAYTLSESVADGFEPCSRCGAPAADVLEAEYAVWTDADDVYHISDACPAFAGEAGVATLSDAEAAGCVPCASCGANALSTAASDAAATDEAALLELAKDVTVYFYDGSIGYHAESSCYGMTGAPARTLYEAIQAEKTRCSRCDPPALEDLEPTATTAP